MNFCLPLQISHPNKGEKRKGQCAIKCTFWWHPTCEWQSRTRAQPPVKVLHHLHQRIPLINIVATFTCLERKQILAEFTVRLFHSHLTTKTLFVFLGVWNAKVKLSSRAVPWWEKTEIATYNSGGVDSQISWKKYMWLEAWGVLLSRSAWNWESLRSCDFLCLKCFWHTCLSIQLMC